MKKILILGVVGIFILTGCNPLGEMEKIGDDVSNSYQKATNEAKETLQEIKDTKAKVDETIDDLKEAKEKLKEASEAVSNIVK